MHTYICICILHMYVYICIYIYICIIITISTNEAALHPDSITVMSNIRFAPRVGLP